MILPFKTHLVMTLCGFSQVFMKLHTEAHCFLPAESTPSLHRDVTHRDPSP